MSSINEPKTINNFYLSGPNNFSFNDPFSVIDNYTNTLDFENEEEDDIVSKSKGKAKATDKGTIKAKANGKHNNALKAIPSKVAKVTKVKSPKLIGEEIWKDGTEMAALAIMLGKMGPRPREVIAETVQELKAAWPMKVFTVESVKKKIARLIVAEQKRINHVAAISRYVQAVDDIKTNSVLSDKEVREQLHALVPPFLGLSDDQGVAETT